MKRTIRRPSPLIALALLLGACTHDNSDLEQYIAEVKARPPAAIEPVPQIREYEPFPYRADGRRDPFVPMQPERGATTAPVGGGIRPDRDRPREPLEEFPLDSLRMVGTIEKGGVRYALVRAPDGVIHRVKVGNHMGQNFGRITRITETEIRLVEIVPDGFGGWMERPAAVALSEK